MATRSTRWTVLPGFPEAGQSSSTPTTQAQPRGSRQVVQEGRGCHAALDAWLEGLPRCSPAAADGAPGVGSRRPRDLAHPAARLAHKASTCGRRRRDPADDMSIADLLDDWFESPQSRARWRQRRDRPGRPVRAGTAYVMAHHSIGDVGDGTWELVSRGAWAPFLRHRAAARATERGPVNAQVPGYRLRRRAPAGAGGRDEDPGCVWSARCTRAPHSSSMSAPSTCRRLHQRHPALEDPQRLLRSTWPCRAADFTADPDAPAEHHTARQMGDVGTSSAFQTPRGRPALGLQDG